MRFTRFLFIVGFFLLASCSRGEDAVLPDSHNEKSPFYISVYSVDTDILKTEVQKSGRISAKSTLTLTSKGVGEVAKVEVKEGTQVKAGAVIARLKDTLTNYDLQLAQAENALKIQNANKETTSINLDSAVENARIAYERAKQAYDTLMNRTDLQYEITVSTNKKTLDAYNENFRSYITELEKSMTQYLHEGDKILGTTSTFEYSNDGWEDYLGAKVGNIKTQADSSWGKLYEFRGELRSRIQKGTEIDRTNPEADIELLSRGYTEMRNYVDTMLYMLQNNAIGGGLSQVQQDGWMLAWNGYRSAVGGSESGYNAWKGQTMSFFNNYKKTELATRLAIKSLDGPLSSVDLDTINADSDLKTTYETTKIDLIERTRNAELSLEQAKVAYESAQSLRSSTLEQLEGSRKSAEISLELARRNADNLIVRAPVNGTITKILTSVGQSAGAGTQIAEFTSNEPEVVLDIESNLARTLSVGEEVDLMVEGKQYSGTIVSLSTIAGKNLLSTLRIAVQNGNDIIGKTATLTFYPKELLTKSGSLAIPLEAVRIISEQEGELALLASDNTIVYKKAAILGIQGSSVTLDISPDVGMEIILSDVSKFDPNKFILTKE